MPENSAKELAIVLFEGLETDFHELEQSERDAIVRTLQGALAATFAQGAEAQKIICADVAQREASLGAANYQLRKRVLDAPLPQQAEDWLRNILLEKERTVVRHMLAAHADGCKCEPCLALTRKLAEARLDILAILKKAIIAASDEWRRKESLELPRPDPRYHSICMGLNEALRLLEEAESASRAAAQGGA